MIRSINTIGLVFLCTVSYSQTTSFFVKPALTNMEYKADQDSHLVVRNSSIHLNRLFVFIGGTGSSSKTYKNVCEYAAGLGFDVVSLAYLNDVAAASLSSSKDSLAFDKYRREVCYGTPLSDEVDVDSLNSIYSRLYYLLKYLDLNHSGQGWGQYLSGNEINWAKIAVAGHSQGAGHAAFFGKTQLLERVLMFAGPNDYSTFFDRSGNWIRTPGLTPVNKLYAYQSLLDELVDFDKQLSCMKGLGIHPLYDTVHVDASSPPYQNSHCLYTTQIRGLVLLYHNTPVKAGDLNEAVWKYMLTSTHTLNSKWKASKPGVNAYPNPFDGKLVIQVSSEYFGTAYSIVNLFGTEIIRGVFKDEIATVNTSDLPKGFYMLNFKSTNLKLIKK